VQITEITEKNRNSQQKAAKETKETGVLTNPKAEIRKSGSTGAG